MSSATANESVELDQQPWGQASAAQLAIVKTGTGGVYSFTVTPSIYTTYVARWKQRCQRQRRRAGRTEDPLAPGWTGLHEGRRVFTGSLWHRHLYLQRLSQFGQWVNIAPLTLGQLNGRLFRPVSYLPKGVSHIRVFLSVEPGRGTGCGRPQRHPDHGKKR